MVGHKFGAPKGVAALYISDGIKHKSSFLHGGGQESGLRAGTENVMLIAALGMAAKVVKDELPDIAAHMRHLRQTLLRKLVEGLPEGTVRENSPADEDKRLPNTLSVGIVGVSASRVLSDLKNDLAASASAACHTETSTSSISAVLLAMKVRAPTLLLTLTRNACVALEGWCWCWLRERHY